MTNYEFMHPKLRAYIEVEQPHIDGWVHTVANFMIPIIDFAQQKKGLVGDMLEIGVWHGKSLLLFEKMAKPEEFVDGYDIELQHALLDNVKNLSSGRIRLHKVDSATLDENSILKERNSKIRLFHVDGYHTYENALSDLTLAVNVISKEGVVILDDFYSPTVPGVTEAFYSLIFSGKSNDFYPFALGGCKVYMCHKSMIGYYRDCLFEHMPMPNKNGVDVDLMFGNRIAVYDLW